MSIGSIPGRPGGRRERRRAATQRLLEDSALRLALEHGVESLTVERISDAADIAPRTFFHYFSSKEAALLPSDEVRLDALRTVLAETDAGEEPVAAAWRGLTAWVRASNAMNREEAAARVRLALNTPSLLPRFLVRFAAVEEVVAGYLAQRRGGTGVGGGDDMRCSVLAAAIVAAFRTAVRWWALDPAYAGRALADVVDEAFAVVFGPSGAGGTGSPA